MRWSYDHLVFIQCTPDISRSCISRNWIYRGRMLDPIFLPNYFAKFADMAPKSTPCIQFAETIFAKSAHRDSLCSCSQETISREINSSLPVNAGWNTCCAIGSHARRSIDTSIVSQSRVQLIQVLIKSSRFDHVVYILHLVRHWDSSAANQARLNGRYSSSGACTPK